MLDQAVSTLLNNAFPDSSVAVSLEGNHCHVEIVSAQFDGLRKLKRQQLVYAALNDYIASGEIHAVHMVLSSPTEAEL